MNSIGILYWTDIHGNDSSTYIYGATSLTALHTYANTLRQYSAAVITDLEWCAEAEVSYDRTKAYGDRKTYTFNTPVQNMKPKFSGMPGAAYSLDYYAAIFIKTPSHRHARRATIPAPLQNVFQHLEVLASVGTVVSEAFGVVVNDAPAKFIGGRFINPKQIHPIDYHY